MSKIILASGNKDKLKEIGEMTKARQVQVLSMKETGFDEEVEETGTTFVDNAGIKAKAIYEFIKDKEEYSDAIVLADDSGLEIDYYDKRPGVYSHRWLGDRTYPQAMTDVINDMKDVPEEKRSARFVCAMVAYLPDGQRIECQETIEGQIAYEMKGENGFGYDPFFYVPSYGCTTAEMTPEQKNEISHRGKALMSMLKKLGLN